MVVDNLFGRENYLSLLEKRSRGLRYGYRQNIAIIGDESIGKTSLIFKFLNKYHDNYTLALYLEIRPEPLASFAKRFIGCLLYNFLLNSGLALKEDTDFLIAKASKYIPRTTQEIKSILAALEKRKKNNIFTALLSLSDILYRETGKSCIIIFDEFQHLENLGIKNLYAEWSKLLMLRKNTMYIVASSSKFKAKTILSKNLSLLFGNFEVVTLEPFTISSSEQYLDARLAKINPDKGLKNFVICFTGGCPFYLEVITDAAIKLNQLNLTQILENLLFEESGILNQRFSNYLKCFLQLPYSQDHAAILYQISCGHNRPKDLAQILRKPQKELALRINQLIEHDALMRNGDFLKINDRVFSFWLRFVYQEKLHSLTFDAKNQQVLFREKIEALIKEFTIKTEKPISERMTELLQQFADQVIQIERKRLKLTHLREIKPMEFGRGSIKKGLIARSCDSLWIIAFKQDALTEDDIVEFSKECKKYRHKQQRKIIITFKDTDANACLRAMEEKIMTWDLNKLNQILDLFSQPAVIA